jgi:hypothetical protein
VKEIQMHKPSRLMRFQDGTHEVSVDAYRFGRGSIKSGVVYLRRELRPGEIATLQLDRSPQSAVVVRVTGRVASAEKGLWIIYYEVTDDPLDHLAQLCAEARHDKENGESPGR